MMILLPGNVNAFKRKVRHNPNRWGWLITPRRSMPRTLHTIPGARWAADNECFALGEDFDPYRYLRFLWRNTHIARQCLFATAPDVVGDAETTLARSGPWLRVIRDLSLPAALVAQDGLESLPVPWNEFDTFLMSAAVDSVLFLSLASWLLWGWPPPWGIMALQFVAKVAGGALWSLVIEGVRQRRLGAVTGE